MWLVKEGARVAEGDPVVEVLAGSVTVDLPAPADGILVEKLVADGEPLAVGQRLAVIEDEIGRLAWRTCPPFGGRHGRNHGRHARRLNAYR